MRLRFFLKHAALNDLLANYDHTTSAQHKGLVFTVDFNLVPVQTDVSGVSVLSPQFLAKASVVGVQGPYIDPDGNLNEIPLTEQFACPHPPPCSLVAGSVNQFELDRSKVSTEAIGICYP